MKKLVRRGLAWHPLLSIVCFDFLWLDRNVTDPVTELFRYDVILNALWTVFISLQV